MTEQTRDWAAIKQAYRDRKKAEGLKEITLWCHPADEKAIRREVRRITQLRKKETQK